MSAGPTEVKHGGGVTNQPSSFWHEEDERLWRSTIPPHPSSSVFLESDSESPVQQPGLLDEKQNTNL